MTSKLPLHYSFFQFVPHSHPVTRQLQIPAPQPVLIPHGSTFSITYNTYHFSILPKHLTIFCLRISSCHYQVVTLTFYRSVLFETQSFYFSLFCPLMAELFQCIILLSKQGYYFDVFYIPFQFTFIHLISSPCHKFSIYTPISTNKTSGHELAFPLS